MITDDVRIVSADDLIEAEVGGDLVGLRIATDSCYGFNGSAARIWALLREPTTFGSLVAALAAEFEAPEAEIRSDTAALLGRLEAEGLVRLGPP